MKVSIGSDHRGVDARQILAHTLKSLNLSVEDCGTHSTESCDYPDVAEIVARQVAGGESDLGILVCGTGIGMAMVANKIRGIRAAVCHDRTTAKLSRQHNDANVLCLSSSIAAEELPEIVNVWLTAEFEGGRHQRRVDKMMQLECTDAKA